MTDNGEFLWREKLLSFVLYNDGYSCYLKVLYVQCPLIESDNSFSMALLFFSFRQCLKSVVIMVTFSDWFWTLCCIIQTMVLNIMLYNLNNGF